MLMPTVTLPSLEPKYVLRPFQEEMVEKALKVDVFACGDDMGLGKTIEGMEVDRRRRLATDQPMTHLTLVVTTLSGTDVWTQHYEDFMPGMPTYTIDPKNRDAFERAVRAGRPGIYICHWDAVRMLPSLRERRWFHIIGDEVHRIKSRKAQVTIAHKKIRADFKLGLSGTFGDDKPQDLWSPWNWLLPMKFSSYWRYFNQYVAYDKSEEGYRVITGVRNVKHFHRLIDPYWIRRRKEDVLDDLPEKYYTPMYIDLPPQQRKWYDQMRKKMLAWVGENEDKPIAAPVEVARLTRLQQFAIGGIEVEQTTRRKRNKYFNHDWPRVEWAPEMGEPDEWNVTPQRNFLWWRKNVTVYKIVDPSAKLDYVANLLKERKDSGDLDAHPVVVFTQFRRAVTLLAERLDKAGITYRTTIGDTPKRVRDQNVRDFQAGRAQVFIGTIGSCRESITLTRASTCIFVDRAWSPSWNRQAEDRLYRIGQANAVQIIDIIARNTVDLGRNQKYKLKWSWLQKMFGDKTLDYQKSTNDHSNLTIQTEAEGEQAA
jgi:SNF2 family DNA or RNA helicase